MILVTGGAGYIGSHVCLELLQQGYEVVSVDHYGNGYVQALERVAQIAGRQPVICDADVRDQAALREIFARHPIDAVVHLAGLKSPAESVRQPLGYYGDNLGCTIALCEAMHAYGVNKLVFSSSAAVYGAQESMPVAEDAPTHCTNPYGRTKLMNEQILRDVAASDPQWGVASLRYFNPIGAHPSGLIGESPRGVPNNLVPYIAQVAAGRRAYLAVYGGDYPTPDGTGVRDYIHVVDLAKAHVCALEFLRGFTGAEVFNVGTGRGYSVLEVLRAYEAACGYAIPYRVLGRRDGDVAVSFADVRKAREELGFAAQLGIEQMCRDACKWQRDNPDGY